MRCIKEKSGFKLSEAVFINSWRIKNASIEHVAFVYILVTNARSPVFAPCCRLA